MFISDIQVEPSAMQNAYQEEVKTMSVFGSLATGSFRIALIILGNFLVGLGCYGIWKLAKRSYRAFTGREPQTAGGLIALTGFGIIGFCEWGVFQLVGCEAQHLSSVNAWQDSTRRLFIRTFDGIFPLLIIYIAVTRMFRWNYVKKLLSNSERRAIPQQFAIASILLVIADLEYFFAERSERYASSAASQYATHAFVVILLGMATKAFVHWFMATKRAYDNHYSLNLNLHHDDYEKTAAFYDC